MLISIANWRLYKKGRDINNFSLYKSVITLLAFSILSILDAVKFAFPFLFSFPIYTFLTMHEYIK